MKNLDVLIEINHKISGEPKHILRQHFFNNLEQYGKETVKEMMEDISIEEFNGYIEHISNLKSSELAEQMYIIDMDIIR